MADTVEIKVPDIGDFKEVGVIEILVKPGDTIEKETSLITVESDKATMEIPSPSAGVVKEVKVKLGDKVAEGSLILTMSSEAPGQEPIPAQNAAKPSTAQAMPPPTVVAPSPAAKTADKADVECDV